MTGTRMLSKSVRFLLPSAGLTSGGLTHAGIGERKTAGVGVVDFKTEIIVIDSCAFGVGANPGALAADFFNPLTRGLISGVVSGRLRVLKMAIHLTAHLAVQAEVRGAGCPRKLRRGGCASVSCWPWP